MLPKTVNEEILYNLFGAYGLVKEVHIIRAPDGSSKVLQHYKVILSPLIPSFLLFSIEILRVFVRRKRLPGLKSSLFSPKNFSLYPKIEDNAPLSGQLLKL